MATEKAAAEQAIARIRGKYIDLPNEYLVDRSFEEGMKAIQSGCSEMVFHGLSNEQMKELSNQLTRNKTLVELGLYRLKIEAEGIKYLTVALKVNRNLEKLSIGDTPLGDEGTCLLANGLEANGTLWQLILKNDQIGNDGAAHLSRLVSNRNTKIRRLWLSENQIGNAGVGALARTLPNTKTLQDLDLSSNKIDAEGATELANSLFRTLTLDTLVLDNNPIGDRGTEALAIAIRRECLKKLTLIRCGINDAGGQALLEAIKVSRSLNSLHLWHNHLGSATSNALTQLMIDKTNDSGEKQFPHGYDGVRPENQVPAGYYDGKTPLEQLADEFQRSSRAEPETRARMLASLHFSGAARGAVTAAAPTTASGSGNTAANAGNSSTSTPARVGCG